MVPEIVIDEELPLVPLVGLDIPPVPLAPPPPTVRLNVVPLVTLNRPVTTPPPPPPPPK